MPFTLDATPGGTAANSFLTVEEFEAYLETAYEVEEASNVLDDAPLLGLATRTLIAMYSGKKVLIREKGSSPYYLVRPTWTGSPAMATQALPWPRIGMYDRNGNAIADTVIPQELKDATAELARQLKAGDRTLDNDVSVQGITSIRASSVALSFKDMIEAKVIPDAVVNLLIPSWLTDETIVPAWPAIFEVVSE